MAKTTKTRRKPVGHDRAAAGERINKLAREVVGIIHERQDPYVDIPSRTLSNVQFNETKRIIELLDTLGVLHLFKVTQGSVNLPGQAEPREHTPASSTKEEVTRTCIEAHQTLMDISPANAAKFKDVAQFLAEGLKKPKSE